jgi:hypothetical protein
MAFYEVYSVL